MGRVEDVVVQKWLIPPNKEDLESPLGLWNRTIEDFWNGDGLRAAVYLGDYYPGNQTQLQVASLEGAVHFAKAAKLELDDLRPNRTSIQRLKLPLEIYLNADTIGFLTNRNSWKQPPLDLPVAFIPDTTNWRDDIRAVSNKKLFRIRGRMGYELGHMDDLRVQSRGYNLPLSEYSGLNAEELSITTGYDMVRAMFLQNYYIELVRRAKLTKGARNSI